MDTDILVSRFPALRRREALGVLSLVAAGATAPIGAAPRRTRFGVNCYELFLGGLRKGGGVGTGTLTTLGDMGVPFIRFPATGQWAGDWARYDTDPGLYLAGMDQLFAAAERVRIGLVPSVFWQPASLPFHLGEPVHAWADPASRTRAVAARYVGEMTGRYGRSSSLLMWEFGNELNDWVDLPNAPQFWPAPDYTVPGRKAGEHDRLSSVELREMVDAFAATVRRTSRRPIGSGFNMPRDNAWHLARGSWDRDMPDQFAEQLRHLTPARCDVLSIHLYPERWGKPASLFADLPRLLDAFVQAAAADRRITFVGEFGVPRLADRQAERRQFEEMLSAIARSRVDYAAVWVFDRLDPDPQWNITATNDRAYQLEALLRADRS